MEDSSTEIICACGARCIPTVQVKFPDGKIELFCDKSCRAYNAAKHKADYLWDQQRENKGGVTTITCKCGKKCALKARVKFPSGEVREFCSRFCPEYKKAKESADYFWERYRQKKQSENFGRAQARKGTKNPNRTPKGQYRRPVHANYDF